MKNIFILFCLISSITFGEWKEVTKSPVGKINLTVYNNSDLEASGIKYTSQNLEYINTLYSNEENLLNNKEHLHEFIIGYQENREKFIAIKLLKDNSLLELVSSNLDDLKSSIDQWENPKIKEDKK
ncbi:hypothetical protein [Cetobacterium sp. SF1]|uniref:hypothetical protein n=1 Tax=Cetobacterium sp. SF1 TaxID=3417654 RepID=UPI003CF68A8F